MRALIAFLVCGAALLAASADADLHAIRKLAPWRQSKCEMDRNRTSTCGIGDDPAYGRFRFDYETTDPDNVRANRTIADLDGRVAGALAARGWSIKPMGEHQGIPDMKRCYTKDGYTVQVFKTTGRCTMNSPCRFYDGFAFIVYESSGPRRPSLPAGR